MILFGAEPTRQLATAVATLLEAEFGELETTTFDDGERRTRPLLDVAGRDVVVVQSVLSGPAGSVHDQLCQLLLLLGTLRDEGAASVTAVAPYLCYTRQDRPVHPHDPVATRHVARLLEAMGVDRVITVDVHNPAAFANAFRVPTISIDTIGLLAGTVAEVLDERPVVVSPDVGSVKRAQKLQAELGRRSGREVPDAFVEKQRLDHVAADSTVVGDVTGCTALLVDDMVATGTTLVRAARACLEHGASRVLALATHGVFSGPAEQVLAGNGALDRLVVTDTVGPLRLTEPALVGKTEVATVAPLLAEAIARPVRARSR